MNQLLKETMRQSFSSLSKYTWAGVGSILLWSTTIAFSRSLAEQLGSLTAATWIYLLAGVLGLLTAEVVRRGSILAMFRMPPRYLAGCGALFVLYIACLYLAVGAAQNRGQVLAVGLINYLWPGLSLVFSIPILGHRARSWLPVGILLGLAGVALAVTSSDPAGAVQNLNPQGSLAPYGLSAVAAVSWGLYSNLSKRWGGDEEGNAVPLFLLASGAVLGTLLLFAHETPRWGATTWLELAYMVFFPAMLAYALWDTAVRRGNLILIASLSYLTPLLSTIISSLVLGVAPGPGLWLGALLVMAGAVLCKISVYEAR